MAEKASREGRRPEYCSTQAVMVLGIERLAFGASGQCTDALAEG